MNSFYKSPGLTLTFSMYANPAMLSDPDNGSQLFLIDTSTFTILASGPAEAITEVNEH